MKEIPALIYLHGLGSSPDSPKARLFARHFASVGWPLAVPQLSVPSLQRLSVEAALATASEALRNATQGGRVILIGSSFGGYLALHALNRLAPATADNIAGLALLAPVLYPWHPEEPIISPSTEAAWKHAGVFPIEEGATGTHVPVHYGFLEELRECARDELSVSCPTLVVHGVRDATVPHRHSVEFVRRNSAAQLVSLDDDHQMMKEPHSLVSLVEEFIRGVSK
jgi:pimeloyl-ACP methyl ester carboxylesterase